MTDTPPLRAAIVGAGPSGFYAAGQLLAVGDPEFAVDLYDRLPTPYGLVRSGVAPDHPKIKSVTRAYDKTTAHERFRFFGHVELGSDITRRQLLDHYHVVLYTLGTLDRPAARDPGEELRGSHAATEFVAWYNGHPDHSGLEVDLRASRWSSSEPATSRSTSRGCSRWHRRSSRSPIRRTMRSRCSRPAASRRSRSSLAADRCRRRSRIPSCSRWACSSAPTSRSSAASWTSCRPSRSQEADKTRRRNVEILQDYAARPKTGKPITVRFRFLASPVELLGDENGNVRAREDREERDRRTRRRLAGRTRQRDLRRDTGPARVPLDRLHRPAGRRHPLRRAARPDPQRGRAGDRSRRHAPASASTCPAGSSAARPA